MATNSPWSIKLFSALPGCSPLHRTPFSIVVRMRAHSLVPKPKTTVISLGARLVHSVPLIRFLPVLVFKAYAVGKAVHLQRC